ncbi:hypothetical protein ElyMa_003923700 [Elysia marginata]|uniref:Uncharacterized protein n=1 Tax=Elysia marginata TaxID=1093978 RepID=A0AAV4FQF9_9GAST|nr:hypothetical protein ElyMa_003923700 [Elysia marginata]
MNFFLDFFYPEKRRREKEGRERQQRQAEQCLIEAQEKKAEKKASTAAAAAEAKAARQAQQQHAQQSYLFNNNLYVHGGADYNSDGIVAYGISRRRAGSGRHAPNRLASHAYYSGYSSGSESLAATTRRGAAVPGYASEGYTYINRRVHPAFYGIPYDSTGYSSSGGSYAPPQRIKLKKGARRSRKFNPGSYPDGTVSKTSVSRTNPPSSEGERRRSTKKSVSTAETISGDGGRSRSRRRTEDESGFRSGNTTDTTAGRPRQNSGTSFPGMFGRTRSRTLVFPFRRERGSFWGTFRLKYDPRLLRAYDERNRWAMTMLYIWNSKFVYLFGRLVHAYRLFDIIIMMHT